MNAEHTEVEVERLPACDICSQQGQHAKAHYDGKTLMGPWGYMCKPHFEALGVGLGLGRGQRLIVRDGGRT